MGDGGDGFEVRKVGVRVAEGLEVDELGVLLDGVLELLRVSAETKVVVMPSRGRVWRSRLKVPPYTFLAATMWSPDWVMLRTAYSTAAAPDATARPAVPPSRAAMRSRTRPGWSWSDGRRCCPGPPVRSGPRRGRSCGRRSWWSGRSARAGVGGRVGLLLADVQLQGFETIVLVCHDALSLDKGSLFSSWLPPALPCRALGQVLVATINRPASATQAERYRTCLYPLINRWNHRLSPLPQPLKKPFGTIRHAEVPHAGDPP